MDHLKSRWLAFHEEHPGVRYREAARELGVTEAELLSALIDENLVKVDQPVAKLLALLAAKTPARFGLRGDYASLEVTLPLPELLSQRDLVYLQAEKAQLELLVAKVESGFQVCEANPFGATERSLRLFDRQGVEILRVFVETFAPRSQETPSSGGAKSRTIFDYYTEPGLQNRSEFGEWINPFPLRKFVLACEQEKVPVYFSLFNGAAHLCAGGQIVESGMKGLWLEVTGDGFSFRFRHTQLGSAWRLRLPFLEDPAIEFLDKTGEPLFLLSTLHQNPKGNKTWNQLMHHFPLQA